MTKKRSKKQSGKDGRNSDKKKVTIKYKFTDYRVFPVVMQDDHMQTAAGTDTGQENRHSTFR